MALTDGLAEFWSFNDTLVGINGTTLTGNVGTNYVAGKVGNAWYVDGSANYILSAASPWNPGDADWSLSMWWKLDESAANSIHYLLQLYDEGTGEVLQVYLSRVFLGFTSVFVQAKSVQLNPTDAEWHHLAARYVASTDILSMWLDGSQTDFAGVAGLSLASDPTVYVGRLANPITFRFDGTIDALGIWDRALSNDEVAELYNSGDGAEITLPDVPTPGGIRSVHGADSSNWITK